MAKIKSMNHHHHSNRKLSFEQPQLNGDDNNNDNETNKIEDWLDEHPDFYHVQSLINGWLHIRYNHQWVSGES
ncbi:hypothetical protein BLA29_007863 [Euroglyphus maynei]|uniref:Uncharacterized protein n=1 Tax=Euroglyphus maynei TaxID=6958 RepID=A0A1Y3BFP2_EURMA|nr:hypothetical protein BLA29_007863 [Euroglyphus maynei]